jgi:hypothetical protein
MNKDAIMLFLEQQHINLSNGLPESLSLFKFTCTKYWYRGGDLNDKQYDFLVAAPNLESAQVWVEVEFLACGQSFDSHTDLKAHLEENEVPEDDLYSTVIHGAQDVGDMEYRAIDFYNQVDLSDALVLLQQSSLSANCYLA